MGRPKKELSKDQIAQVEALGSVLSLEQIADYFGIGKTTFYEIMKRQPEVSERYKKGKSKAIRDVAKTVLQQAKKGNTAMALFYLKTQAGWREKDSSEGEETEAAPVQIIIKAQDARKKRSHSDNSAS